MSQHHLLFEEAGQFKTGTILQDAGASLQVELPTGKRVKVKQGNVMLRFDAPGPAEMLAEACRKPRTSTSIFCGKWPRRKNSTTSAGGRVLR